MQVFGTSAAASALAQLQLQKQAASSASGSGSSGSGTTNPTASLTSESTFLQLLVAQIKNQNPLNPTDSIQFVGQLVQYSELEQLIGINKGVNTLTGSTPPPTTTGTSSS
jgi:flagellar basal-body rod modification protein FlgD